MYRGGFFMKEKTKSSFGGYILEQIKTLVVALIITLVLVLIAAFAIKLFNIPTKAIVIINQVIKGFSVLVSTLICFKLPKGGYIRGIIFGLLYVLLTFLVFSLFNGSFSGGLSLINDITFGAVTGLISGIIAVNLRNKR